MGHLDEVSVAGLELARAGRWETAMRLLDSSEPDDPRIAMAAAEVALEWDLRTGSDRAAERLETAERLAAAEPASGNTWDLEFLRFRIDYFGQLFLGFGPEGKDRSVLDELRDRAAELTERAPDRTSAGWAHMFHGLILDNLLAERDEAPAHYAIALSAGEDKEDDLLTWEALRHLGDHDRDDGRLDRARERWERATALGAAAGKVGGTLAQQMMLAVLARDTGDEAGATALAREVSRWAGAIGAVRQQRQADAFLRGAPVA